MTLHTHHITVAINAPERLGRNNVNSWLSHTLERGMTGNTAQTLAVACNVDARELVDNTDLYNITTQVITTNRPPLPAPVVKLFKVARAAEAGGRNIDTVTFTIDGRVFLFDQWNFGKPDFHTAPGSLSDAMEEATRFVADSYILPVTFEWPDDMLGAEQKDTLTELRTVLQVAMEDGSLAILGKKLGLPVDPSPTIEAINTLLKENA